MDKPEHVYQFGPGNICRPRDATAPGLDALIGARIVGRFPEIHDKLENMASNRQLHQDQTVERRPCEPTDKHTTETKV